MCNCENNIDTCFDCGCEDTGCKINLDASCIFYNLIDTNPSKLTCVAKPNGTNLKVILEELDRKLCSITTLNYSTYDLSCLRDTYSILTNKNFAEAVAREICLLKSDLNTYNTNIDADIVSINNTISSILNPDVQDNCFLGILPTDTIIDILQKILNSFCTLQNNNNLGDQSPILNAISTNSINFVTSGTKNHNILASVKVSPDSGNVIEVRGNGLFVNTPSSGIQTISFDSLTRVVTLSGGGGSFVLPADDDDQTLSFNSGTKQLSISGGNTVDLSSLSSTPTETFISVNDTNSVNLTASGTSNHTISADVKISATVGNQLSENPDGLFVPASTPNIDDTVIGDILTDIDLNPTLKLQLYNLFIDSVCFKFRLKNTGGSPQTYDYTDCTGSLVTGVNINAGATADITGKSVDVSSTDVEVYNFGIN